MCLQSLNSLSVLTMTPLLAIVNAFTTLVTEAILTWRSFTISDLDTPFSNAVVPRVYEGYYNEKQSLRSIDAKVRFIQIKTVR